MQTDNPYILGNPSLDRQRLETQTKLFSDYIRCHAREFCGDDVHSILDVGCGEGQLGLVLHEVYPDARLVGVDRDNTAIASAGFLASQHGLSNYRYIPMDLDGGDALPNGGFDLIYCSFILIHVKDPRGLLKRLFAKLNPGGHIWVKDFDPEIYRDPAMSLYLGGRYIKMIRMMLELSTRTGHQVELMTDLPAWLGALGAAKIRTDRESFKVGGRSDEGVAGLAVALGAFLNAIPNITRYCGYPEPEMKNSYAEVVNLAFSGMEEVRGFTANIIAENPGKERSSLR